MGSICLAYARSPPPASDERDVRSDQHEHEQHAFVLRPCGKPGGQTGTRQRSAIRFVCDLVVHYEQRGCSRKEEHQRDVGILRARMPNQEPMAEQHHSGDARLRAPAQCGNGRENEPGRGDHEETADHARRGHRFAARVHPGPDNGQRQQQRVVGMASIKQFGKAVAPVISAPIDPART
jgi:hypothetical protein